MYQLFLIIFCYLTIVFFFLLIPLVLNIYLVKYTYILLYLLFFYFQKLLSADQISYYFKKFKGHAHKTINIGKAIRSYA